LFGSSPTEVPFIVEPVTAPENVPVVPETAPEKVPATPVTVLENVPVVPETAPENVPVVLVNPAPKATEPVKPPPLGGTAKEFEEAPYATKDIRWVLAGAAWK